MAERQGPLRRRVDEGDPLLEVHPGRIRRRVAEELPFMATERIILRAVEAGADRQEVHEVIRRHSIAAARAVKDEGRHNDMLERLAADAEFGVPVDDLRRTLDPKRFIGRAPEQVDEFLAEHVTPLLASPRASAVEREELRV